jgi:hypothetical protein
MPHQRLTRLLEEMQAAQGDVRHVRAYCDTMQDRMVCEFEAPDGDVLAAWLSDQNISYQWLFRVEFYAEGDDVQRL